MDSHPVAHRLDFAKGNARLHHAEWTRIHSQENHFFGAFSKPPGIGFVSSPRIGERVIYMRHRRSKPKFFNRDTKLARGCNQLICA